MTDYITLTKADLARIEIGKLNLQSPDLKNIDESKAVAIAKWMKNWIDSSLSLGKIKSGNLMPTKNEFAYFLRD